MIKYINKKIVKDLGLNIFASMISTGILQILIYPSISSKVNVDMFGIILTLMGISNAIGVMFGASLNNVKLLKQKCKDKNKNYKIYYSFDNIIRHDSNFNVY